MTTELAKPDFAAEVSPWASWARGLAITTPEEFTGAAEQLKAIKALEKEIERSYGPLKTKAWQTHKAIVLEEKRQLAPLLMAERKCKRAMLCYQEREENKRRIEQVRLQAAADLRARKEREALEAAAKRAKKPETQQRYEEAAAAVVAPVIEVASQAPSIDGISTRTVTSRGTTSGLSTSSR